MLQLISSQKKKKIIIIIFFILTARLRSIHHCFVKIQPGAYHLITTPAYLSVMAKIAANLDYHVIIWDS